jgi:hypothetical protein
MAVNLQQVAREWLSMKSPTEEQIRKRAYEIYLRHRKPGRDVIDWLQAELELMQMSGYDKTEASDETEAIEWERKVTKQDEYETAAIGSERSKVYR